MLLIRRAGSASGRQYLPHPSSAQSLEKFTGKDKLMGKSELKGPHQLQTLGKGVV